MPLLRFSLRMQAPLPTPSLYLHQNKLPAARQQPPTRRQQCTLSPSQQARHPHHQPAAVIDFLRLTSCSSFPATNFAG